MNFGDETQRAFVNTWECDENDHLNVQFYWKRFGDAAQVLQLKSKVPPARFATASIPLGE